MFKFLRKHPPKDSEERERLKKELFGYRPCMEHGFPSKPSSLAYDPKLGLLAIGTKSGLIKVVGAPGVEYSAHHKDDVAVNQLFFLPEQGRLISLCGDNSLHLWEINLVNGKPLLEEKKKIQIEESGKCKSISVCSLTKDSKQLLMGTENGNIQILDVEPFILQDHIIYQDVVMQNVPDDFKVNPGAVEAIAVHPTNPNKFLIGYNRGLIVLWDNKESNGDQTYTATQQLESLSWNRNGKEFMSAHIDGSYIVWSASDSAEPKESALTPYGPFPCKSINKVEWKTAKSDPFIIFSGGMPRASYGDRHTVSVMQGSGSNHIVFDFTSKVVDFVTITRADLTESDDRDEYDEPHALVVLVEEELVVIDLDSPNWPVIRLPYMNSLHSSAITCSQHVSNVPDQLWQKIIDAGDIQSKHYSSRDWPISGGKLLGAESLTKDILLTGHEDGSIRFWDASGTSMKLLYKLNTAGIYNVDVHPAEQNSTEVEEEWPPFRKVGTYDPFSDDPRLGIQKIAMCPLSETLVVAGTAGQVAIFQMERDERELEIPAATLNIVSDRDGFVWKGHEALTTREGECKFTPGFQPVSSVQLYPPAACTALAFHSEWQLVAAGTAHGFALFDYAQKKEVLTKCTLNPHDMTGTSETPMSRRKSLKKSLRESFRRLRKRRSERRKAAEAKPDKKIEEQAPAEGAAAPGTPSTEGTTRASPGGSPEATRPVERQVEARSTEDSMASMVRCIYFATTFISNDPHAQSCPSLWVGTNGGHIYIYSMTVPTEKRMETDPKATLAKEIKLKHKAPVISIGVVDSRARVLPEPLEVQHERAKAPEANGHHSVVICSEEQLKIFSLPHLKAKWKYKLTAYDGSRIRKVAFVNFRSRSDENYSENDVACLSNLGDLSIYSVTNLKQQLVASSLKREDIVGISSFTFTKYGQGFFLVSASEYSRVTLSARNITEPQCDIELAEGMRPEPPPEPEPTPEPPKSEVPETAPDAAETTEAASAATEEPKTTEETQPAEGEIITSQPQYDSGDIAEALNESQLNDSRADTTIDAEVTQDSIQVIEEIQETVTESSSSSTTVVVTSVVRESSTMESSSTVESSSSTVVERSSEQTTTTTETSNVDDDTKASQTSTTEKMETIEKISDLKIQDPADVDTDLLKKVVQETTEAQIETVVAS